MNEIPLIDLQSINLHQVEGVIDKDLRRIGEHLVNALSGVGFTYLQNVGIEEELIRSAFEVFRILFQSPLEKKLKYPFLPKYHGFVLMGEENVDSEKPDQKEAFGINCGIFEDDQEYPWPDDISPLFSKVLKEFLPKCRSLSLRILEAIAVGLDLKDKQYFMKCHSLMHTKENLTAMRSSYYPAVENAQPGENRLGEHSDCGTITLLFQDDVGGLQIKNTDGDYIDVKPIENTIVLNVGDTLQFWTKHKLKATKHRVVFPPRGLNRIRQSIAYFADANNNTIIDTVQQDTNEESSKEPMTVEKFMKMRMAAFAKS